MRVETYEQSLIQLAIAYLGEAGEIAIDKEGEKFSRLEELTKGTQSVLYSLTDRVVRYLRTKPGNIEWEDQMRREELGSEHIDRNMRRFEQENPMEFEGYCSGIMFGVGFDFGIGVGFSSGSVYLHESKRRRIKREETLERAHAVAHSLRQNPYMPNFNHFEDTLTDEDKGMAKIRSVEFNIYFRKITDEFSQMKSIILAKLGHPGWAEDYFKQVESFFEEIKAEHKTRSQFYHRAQIEIDKFEHDVNQVFQISSEGVGLAHRFGKNQFGVRPVRALGQGLSDPDEEY